MDIGPSSCLKKFSAGLKPETCCLLKLRVDLRAQAALKRFSSGGKNNFPQVRHSASLASQKDLQVDFVASQASNADAITVTETTSTELPIVVTGTFGRSSSLNYPLIGVSTDNGSSWNMSNSTRTPATTPSFLTLITDYDFKNTVSCNGDGVCAFGNAYNPLTDPLTTNPLLGFTSDGTASTWSYPEALSTPSLTPAYEAQYEGSGLYDTACTKSFCAATGLYVGQYNGVNSKIPLTAIGTNDSGTWSWAYLLGTDNLDNLDPAYSALYSSQTITCTSSFCINGGYYESSSLVLPLIGVGTNSSGTWSWDYVKASSYTSLIPDFSYLLYPITGSACNKDFCFVVGNYVSTSNSIDPLLLQSSDASDVTSSWTYPTGINTSNITPTFVSDSYLNAASCIGATCIAVGSFIGEYTNTSDFTANTQLPLVALTNDAGSISGTTWNYQSDITSSTILPASFISDGTLADANCRNTDAVIAVYRS